LDTSSDIVVVARLPVVGCVICSAEVWQFDFGCMITINNNFLDENIGSPKADPRTWRYTSFVTILFVFSVALNKLNIHTNDTIDVLQCIPQIFGAEIF